MKKAFLIGLFLASCGSNTEKVDEKKEEKFSGPEKRIIGRIASTPRDGEFVLIQRFGTGSLPENVIYQSQGPNGRNASIRPSGERVRDFFAADLLSGEVEKGDAVMAYANPTEEKKSEPETEPEEKSESPTPSEAPDSGEQLNGQDLPKIKE